MDQKYCNNLTQVFASGVSRGVVLSWLIRGLGCWFGYQLILQNGRILQRIEALEQQLAQLAPSEPGGLPVGTDAPTFELPDLNGNLITLEQFRERRVLLVFFDAHCGYCQQMAPDLAALPWDGSDGHPVPLVVASGDVEENRKLIKEYGVRCPVLLQKDWEIGSLYQTDGTPSGYLIDEQGKIASKLAGGAQTLLALSDAPPTVPTDQESHEVPVQGNGHKTYKGNRALANSRIKRDGLPAGTPAPDFRLPGLGGGELSLEQYRGRRVLLVFSDPDCGPCNALAPELERLHRRTPDLQILMVSRGDPEANRAKVAEHGLTFPIVLQRQWEISRNYGMFATPIGYLIDEDGIITADVAVGVDSILALASTAVDEASRKEGMPMR